MRKRFVIVFAGLLPLSAAGAQRQQGVTDSTPSRVVAARAQAIHLDPSYTARVTWDPATIVFTRVVAADLPRDGRVLAKGCAVGVLDLTDAVGPLTRGQYDVYVSHASTGWEAVLERDGHAALRTRDVIVHEHAAVRGPDGKTVIVRPGLEINSGLAADSLVVNLGGPMWELHVGFAWKPEG